MERRLTLDRLGSLYGAAGPSYFDQVFEETASFADLRDGDGVLEIGCGAGPREEVLPGGG